MKLNSSRSRAFTIVELLTVLVIITILVTLISVVYTNSRRSSRDVRRKADVSTYAQAFQAMYSTRGTLSIAGTGANNWGYGRMTFTGTEGGLKYGSTSIAQGLLNLGFIKNIANDPSGQPNKAGQPDYVFVRCDGTVTTNTQTFGVNSNAGAVWTKLENSKDQNAGELDNTVSACGSDKSSSRFSFGYTADVNNEDTTLFPSPPSGNSNYEKIKAYFASTIGHTF